jgi:hypothetical protein
VELLSWKVCVLYVYWFVRETKSFFDEKYDNLQELESDRTTRTVPKFSTILLTSISTFFVRKFQNESMFWKLNSIVGHMKQTWDQFKGQISLSKLMHQIDFILLWPYVYFYSKALPWRTA